MADFILGLLLGVVLYLYVRYEYKLWKKFNNK